MRRIVCCLLAIGTFALAHPDQAESQRIAGVGVDVDNDFFTHFDPRRSTDYEYTHGTRFWVDLAGPSSPFARIVGALRSCNTARVVCQTQIEVGQAIYTPRQEHDSEPIPGERPHAGWLYLGLGSVRADERSTMTYRVQLGVVGPAALAEEFQGAVHRLFDFREPQGWDQQLPFEPGLQLHVGRSEQLISIRQEFVTLTGGYGLAADFGNVLAQGEAHFFTRLCFGESVCNERVRSDKPRHIAVVLVGRVGPGLVLRNVFLDGTLFRSSHSVKKSTGVLAGRAAIQLQVKNIILGYEVVTRGREYVTEPDGFTYATIRLSFAR